MKPIVSLTYISNFSKPLCKKEIEKIEKKSRRNNAMKNITGMLLIFRDRFFQIIEGEQDEIECLFQKITQNPLHSNIITIRVENIEKRKFFSWTTKNLFFNDQVNLLIRQPMQSLFYTMLEQMKHRCYLENVMLKSIRKNAENILQVGFDECFELVEADRGGLFQWNEKEEIFLSSEIIGSVKAMSAPETLESYMFGFSDAYGTSFTASFPVKNRGKVVAVYVLQKNDIFCEEALRNCRTICLQTSNAYSSLFFAEYDMEKCQGVDAVQIPIEDFTIDERHNAISQFIGRVSSFVKSCKFSKEKIWKKEIDHLYEVVDTLVYKSPVRNKCE